MAVWKKILICLGIAVFLFGSGFFTGFYSTKRSSDFAKAEANRVTSELATARSELEGLRGQNKELTSKLSTAVADNTRLRDRVSELAKTNQRLEAGLGKLREAIDRGATELAGIGNEISDARKTVARCIELVLSLQEESGE